MIRAICLLTVTGAETSPSIFVVSIMRVSPSGEPNSVRLTDQARSLSWVGPQRLVGVAPDGFLRPARRTRRAPLSAPGSPRVPAAFSTGLLLLAWVPKGSRCCRRDSGSGSRRRWMRR